MNGCVPALQCAVNESQLTIWSSASTEKRKLKNKDYVLAIEYNCNMGSGIQIQEIVVRAAKYEINNSSDFIHFYDEKGECVATIQRHLLKIIKIKTQ